MGKSPWIPSLPEAAAGEAPRGAPGAIPSHSTPCWSSLEPPIPHARPQLQLQEPGGSSRELSLTAPTLAAPVSPGRTTIFSLFAQSAASESCWPSLGQDPAWQRALHVPGGSGGTGEPPGEAPGHKPSGQVSHSSCFSLSKSPWQRRGWRAAPVGLSSSRGVFVGLSSSRGIF